MTIGAEHGHVHTVSMAERAQLSELSVLVAGDNAGGASRLVEYLRGEGRPRCRMLVAISHPIAEQVERRTVVLECSASSTRERARPRERSLGLLSYTWDVVLTLAAVAARRRRFDLYVGVMPHLGLLGVLLKRLGVTRRAVFFLNDFKPQRFRWAWLNRLYLKVDELCTCHCDYVWNLSSAIAEARTRLGYGRAENQITVPYPVGSTLPATDAGGDSLPDSMFWAGLTGPEYGFDLVIEAMPLVVRERPNAVVTVTSYQEIPEPLRRRIVASGLERHFNFVGYIPSREEFDRLLRQHRIGLAPYRPDPRSFKRYSDVSRPRNYMAGGLPVIMTAVPPSAAEMEREGAGIVINYDREELAEAILKLLSDDEFYRQCRENAINLAQRYRADRVFPAAFQRMGIEV